ncbi:hypothetical protein GGI07_000745 [Coemansia sp. Benny D115]|nr:hypothetical protein GGI07_000745 [Coemansia sp. Benny D115]
MSCKIYVGSLPYSLTHEGFKESFSEYGTIEESNIVMDHVTSRSRGYGFITYSTPEEAELAINSAANKVIDGRNVVVRAAVERDPSAPRQFQKREYNGGYQRQYSNNDNEGGYQRQYNNNDSEGGYQKNQYRNQGGFRNQQPFRRGRGGLYHGRTYNGNDYQPRQYEANEGSLQQNDNDQQ